MNTGKQGKTKENLANMENEEEGDNMATMTYPCNSPMIIKEGRLDSFLKKCKSTNITDERKKQIQEYSKFIKRERNVK